MLSKDPLYKKMSEETKKEIVSNSFKCASVEFKKLHDKFGDISLVDYAKRFDLKVIEDNEALQNMYMYVSLYIAQNSTIKISNYSIDKIKECIESEDLSSIINKSSLRDIALSHELFHHIEEKSREIYTKEKTFENLIFGKIKIKTCPIAASEIAAVEFSRLLSKIEYSPLIYEIILVYSVTTENREKYLRDTMKFMQMHN